MFSFEKNHCIFIFLFFAKVQIYFRKICKYIYFGLDSPLSQNNKYHLQ